MTHRHSRDVDFTPALMGAMLDRLGCDEATAVRRGPAFS